MSKYEDIMDLKWPKTTTRKRMSLHDRAAQFAPFAALTGHDSAEKETARLTDHKIILSSEQESDMNYVLGLIQEVFPTPVEAQITYFQKDPLKDGGAYITRVCEIKRIDEFEKRVMLTDRSYIMIEDILDIRCGLLKDIEE